MIDIFLIIMINLDLDVNCYGLWATIFNLTKSRNHCVFDLLLCPLTSSKNNSKKAFFNLSPLSVDRRSRYGLATTVLINLEYTRRFGIVFTKTRFREGQTVNPRVRQKIPSKASTRFCIWLCRRSRVYLSKNRYQAFLLLPLTS